LLAKEIDLLRAFHLMLVACVSCHFLLDCGCVALGCLLNQPAGFPVTGKKKCTGTLFVVEGSVQRERQKKLF
jgi:hypothetical protein